MSISHSIFLPAGSFNIKQHPPSYTQKYGLLYFIPGNPGLIDYYEPFFDILRFILDDEKAGVSVDIYGKSLAGFHDDDHEPFTDENPPYGLEDQINFAYVDLSKRRIEGSKTRNGQPYDFVIVMGHSVGSYIALEMFHRHLKDDSKAPHLKLHHGILLFPTITHIAQSPSGRKLDLLRTVPFLDQHAHRLAQAAVAPFPELVLRWFTGTFLGMSDSSARVTAGFLKSRDGIWQALHMGKDEMARISEDKWDEELWEIPHDAEEHRQLVPKFMFLFGKHDHWVANHIRDEFIESRQTHSAREGPEHKKGRTDIEIDEDGKLPHAFCTREMSSIIVADRVRLWISQIQRSILHPNSPRGESPGTSQYGMKM